MRLCAAASPKYSSGDRRLVAVEIAGQPTPDVPFLLRPHLFLGQHWIPESHCPQSQNSNPMAGAAYVTMRYVTITL